jgi:hypothetical protein
MKAAENPAAEPEPDTNTGKAHKRRRSMGAATAHSVGKKFIGTGFYIMTLFSICHMDIIYILK